MDPANPPKQREPEGPRFLDFPHLADDARLADGTKRLNRYSSTITKDHDFPGAQVKKASKNQNVPKLSEETGYAVRRWRS